MELLTRIRFSEDSVLKLIVLSLAAYFASSAFVWAHADVVNVKYRGVVDLAPLKCESISRSSLVTRVCYDSRESYMIINLQGTYYHYCEIDRATVVQLLQAQSMGRYYNQAIKGRFDGRTHHMPMYR